MNVHVDMTEVSVLIPALPKEMISVRKLDDGRRLVRINSSSLDVIQNCMRKAQLLLHEGWKPEVEGPALTFGSAIHAALEVYYQGKIEERTVPSLEDLERMTYGHGVPDSLCTRAFAAFMKKAEPLSALPEGDKRHPLNGAWILWNYFKAYKDDPYVCYVDEEGPFVERGFSFVLHSDSEKVIELFGTIDIVFWHIDTGRRLPGDHKTTSSFGFGDSNYFDREKPNHQYTGYLMGAREVFGVESSEFCVNVVEVKAKPKTARGTPPSFPRQITSRSKEDFAEFTEVVVDSVSRYLRAMDTGIWPLGPVGACNSYGSCQYRQVCSAPPSLRNNILTSKFKKAGTNAPL